MDSEDILRRLPVNGWARVYYDTLKHHPSYSEHRRLTRYAQQIHGYDVHIERQQRTVYHVIKRWWRNRLFTTVDDRFAVEVTKGRDLVTTISYDDEQFLVDGRVSRRRCGDRLVVRGYFKIDRAF